MIFLLGLFNQTRYSVSVDSCTTLSEQLEVEDKAACRVYRQADT